MISPGHAVRCSFHEYIAHERASPTRNEHRHGHIVPIAGGSPEHSALIASVTTHLSVQVRGGRCRVHMSDLRIRVAATGLATYPDVAVVCGPWQRDPDDEHTVTNPVVLVEVLSSTAAYDRGEKLEHYKLIPTLRACVLVALDRRELEVWHRDPDGPWSRVLVGPGQRAELPAILATLDVDALFADAAEPR